MRNRFLLASALLALALLSWNFSSAVAKHAMHLPGAPEHGASMPSPSGRDTRSARPGSTWKLALRPLRDTVQLSPEEVPFSTAYSELKRLADAGSPRAGCRLAFELMRCQAFTDGAGVRHALEEREALDDSRGTAWAANVDADKQIEVARRTADCRKLAPGGTLAASDYLYRAANAGNLAAQVRYIRGQMFGAVADESQH